MDILTKPHITIKENAQKGGYKFSDILTPDVLSDVCVRMFGEAEYSVTFDSSGYNKGRLAVIEFGDCIAYVTFSEHGRVEGRNSFFQSLTTAFISYCTDTRIKKRIAFYFLPSISGSFEAEYFRFMYRLMATNGVEFINPEGNIQSEIIGFASVDDIIASRGLNRGKNATNNSTYITRSKKDVAQIFGKTYGASKKESTLLCLAVARLARQVQMFEICEQALSTLPAPDKLAIERMGNVEIISTNRTMERRAFDADPNFRSPRFIYNLLQKFEKKECAFCECAIPEIIQGAHVWPVADIKRYDRYTEEEKLSCATDGENGLWLCHNHHKMFDENIITIASSGKLIFDNSLSTEQRSFLDKITTKPTIGLGIMTSDFSRYLKMRNELLCV